MKIKKNVTIFEALLTIIGILGLVLILIQLISTLIYKREQIGYNLKRININTTFNSGFGTLVCYFNNHEQTGINSNGEVQYKYFNVRNSTNTDAENKLCSSIWNKGKLEGNNFLGNYGEKVNFDAFILTRSNFKNIATYKIMYVLKVQDDSDSKKAQSYILRFGSTSIEGFLQDNLAHNLYSKLVLKSPQGKINGKDITADQYGFKFKKININMIDDEQVDINPTTSGGGSTSIDDYTFNYNYFLFQLQFSDNYFSNLDYFLFKN